MTARDIVRVIAARLDCTVEAEGAGRHFEVRVEAPAGHHFIDGLHELVSATVPGEPSTEAWHDMADRLRLAAVEPCGDECEWSA